MRSLTFEDSIFFETLILFSRKIQKVESTKPDVLVVPEKFCSHNTKNFS